MKKEDFKKNAQRMSFTNNFKRKALLEFSKGKSCEEILNDISKSSNDKKYSAKLLHKWRKEMYKNKEILSFLPEGKRLKNLSNEIDTIGSDDEEDDIETEFLTRKNNTSINND